MAKRNVVDFRIINLSEEKFQELKEAGQIDPNAVYLTPDTSLKEKHITNCITEIPQDIKLELLDGTLTLKAGSKVYMPNGAGVFDSVPITDDLVMPSVAGTRQVVVYVLAGGTSLNWQTVGTLSSGTTDSLAGTEWHLWYDTSNNIINRYGDSGAFLSSGHCFPIALCTVTSGVITSIDQVFNGFGYIGSNVFTLPGVKGLYPNGRNKDGTLKNGIVECTTVQVSSVFTGTAQLCLFLRTDGRCQWYGRQDFYYNEETNTIHHSQNHIKLNAMDAGTFDVTSGVISNFNPKTSFRAVDYSEYAETKNSLDNKVSEKVNKSGDTMTGNLVINDGDVIFKDTQTAVSPSSDAWHKSIVQFLDKNNVRVGWMQPYFKTDGTMELRLVSYDPVNGNKYLNIGSNGSLVWNNKSVITTAGGTFTGNIAIQKETPQINLKSTVMDITSDGWTAGRNTIAWCMDKNGYESAGIYNTTDTGGTARASLYVMSRKSGSQVQANLGVAVNSSGGTYATAPNTPDGAGSNEIVTAGWAKSKFLPLAGGTITGNITTKSQIYFENASSTGHRGFLYKTPDGGLSMGILKSDNSGWQSSQSFFTTGQYQVTVRDDTNTKNLIARPDGTLTWDGKPIVRLVAEQKATSANNYTWYRKYSDGWAEQGGKQLRGGTGVGPITVGSDTVNLPVSMVDEYYTIQLTSTNSQRYVYSGTQTTTYFKFGTADDSSSNNDGIVSWYVCGYAA